jgi:2-hydroxychromene-2-carboxylate isomerase
MTKPSLDFWFDFASTYSYPAAMRIASLAETSSITVRWRPFMLGPIFKAQGWATSPFNLYPAKGRNMWRDLERVCAALDLPFTRPDPFPNSPAARAALVALAVIGVKLLLRHLSRGIREAAHRKIGRIGEILKSLGQDSNAVLERAQSIEIKSQLREQTEEAQRLGIFGSPSFVTVGGELFWGNDRLETALDWARR